MLFATAPDLLPLFVYVELAVQAMVHQPAAVDIYTISRPVFDFLNIFFSGSIWVTAHAWHFCEKVSGKK